VKGESAPSLSEKAAVIFSIHVRLPKNVCLQYVRCWFRFFPKMPRIFRRSLLHNVGQRVPVRDSELGWEYEPLAPMKTNPYYTWLRKRTASHNFGMLTDVGVRPALTNAQLVEFFDKAFYTVAHGSKGQFVWKKRYLPRLTNQCYDYHMEGIDTFYFQGSGQASVAETLVMIDIDCRKCLGIGSKEGAQDFADHLKEAYFPDLRFEPSTNGNGMHGYVVVHKLGCSAKTVNAQLRTFEQWLKQEAKRVGADIEGVEVKGSCPVFEWKDKRLVSVKSGTNAKLPRGDIRATTHIVITDLAKFVPVPEIVPVVRKCSPGSSSASWCPKAITPTDLADMPKLRRVALMLGLPKDKCSGRVAVTVEDVAVFLLLLRFFTINMNQNGTLPWARFEALWTALYQAGDTERAFNPKRFASIRNHLSALILEGETLLEWEDETYSAGMACKWRASARLMEMMEEERETSSTETDLAILDDCPRPRASWQHQKQESRLMRRLLTRTCVIFEQKRRLAA